jgi:hypothetical protein
MVTSQAQITTPHASKYLQQLCKHFGHKLPVTFTPEQGRIELPFGSCDLNASDTALTLHLDAGDSDIARAEKVITDHLGRFAFRENPTVTWQRAA